MPLTDTWQRYSVQSRAKAEPVDYGPDHVFNWLVQSHDLVAPWWSRARDADLRDLWPSNDYLSGTVYTLVAKLTALPWKIVPQDNTIISHVRLAEELAYDLIANSEMGQGWIVAFSKWLIDHFCQDGGAYFEIYGPGRPSGPIRGQPLGIAHMDSGRCSRTGSPEFPVVYQDTDGKKYKMHRTRVMFASSLPSPIAEMHGVGLCLIGDSSVLMADGSRRKLLHLVREKSTAEVMTLGDDGIFRPGRIVGWHKNARGERNLVNLRAALACRNRGTYVKNLWLTEDHLVLTPEGWREAGKMQTGDSIVTSCPAPNEKQMAFLVGTLLGDSSLSKRASAHRPRLSFGHCEAQREWFFLKKSIVERDFGFKGRLRFYKLSIYGEVRSYPLWKGETLAQAGFEELFNKFYNSGKHIPLDLLERYCSPLLLASWYLDDGNILSREPGPGNHSPRAAITAEGFPGSEVEAACELLTRKGFRANPTNGGNGKKNINFTVEGSAKLFAAIAPHVPDSMRYKLPRGATEYDSRLWELGRAVPFIDTVIVKSTWEKKVRGRSYNQPKTVFCIDVEATHNFEAGGLIVHNCAISRSLMIARNLSDMLTYESEMYGSRPVNRIILGKGITGRSIMEAFSTAEEQMNTEGLTRFAKSVAIGSTRTDIDLDVIPLSDAPKGYDRRSNTDLGLYTLALAFGVDARELWPATSSGATKADALVQAMKARGKGPGQIIQTVEGLFNSMFLPPYLKFTFDLQDDEEDQLRAAVKGARATCHAANLGSGSVSVRVVREQMMEDGDLSLAQFRELELGDGRLEDGSDVVTLFYSPEQVYRSLLALEGFEDVFSIDDPVVAVESIGRKALEVQERMMQAKPTARFQFKAALAALSSLRDVYIQREKEGRQPAAGTPQAEAQAEAQPQEAAAPGKVQQEAATPQTAQGSPGVSSISGVSHVEGEMKAAAGVKSWAGVALLDGLKARVGRKPAEEDEESISEDDVTEAIEDWNKNMPKLARGILEADGG